MTQAPILWSFRRCPYAIRARLAIYHAAINVELREIVLKSKPQAFRDVSASATVPCLVNHSEILDESLDIMIWALERHDPEGLLDMPETGFELIARNDGPFKSALDHTKYAVRYPELDIVAERQKAAAFLMELEDRLNAQDWLFGSRARLADLALLPFIRQFAYIDRLWFDAQPWPCVISWLDRFLEGTDFQYVMQKFTPWHEAQAPVYFGRRAEKETAK